MDKQVSDSNNNNIILIEDDDLIRELYTTELKSAGFTVDSFASGTEGLKALENNGYYCLLLDIMLPDTNGIEILKKIRKNPKLENLKVIMLTNLGQDSVIKEGMNLGAIGYLIKLAYNPDQMIEEIKKLLQT